MSPSSPPGTTKDGPSDAIASNGSSGKGPDGRRRYVASVGPVLVVSALIAAAIAGYFLVLDRDSGKEPESATEIETGAAPVTRRDLQVRDDLDGTLTFASASTVKSSSAGTVTSLPAQGDTHEPGDVLYALDGMPVILFEGDISMWRSLGIGLETAPLINQLTGTVTAIVKDGSVVRAGDVIYRVNTEPVVALDGSFPAFRTLADGVTDGRDVRQLEQNLVALGFDPDGAVSVDRAFTAATADAVIRMQEALGAESDGIVDLGEVVFMSTPQRVRHVEVASTAGPTGVGVGIGASVQPGSEVLGLAAPTDAPGDGPDIVALEENLAALGFDPENAITVDSTFDAQTEAAIARLQASIGANVDGVFEIGDAVFLSGEQRVSALLVSPGDIVQPGVPILEVTSSKQVVTVELEATRQTLVAVGDEVEVELPDGTEVKGIVSEVSAVARVPQAAAGAEPGDPVIDVTIELPANSSGGLDQSPVRVLVATDSAEQVLTVPVSALLAVAGGGYALEIIDAGGNRFVGVELGLFSDGLVEVTGVGVSENDEVVVPR